MFPGFSEPLKFERNENSNHMKKFENIRMGKLLRVQFKSMQTSLE